MHFAKQLYLTEGLRHVSRIKWKLRHRAGLIDLFVISLAGGTNQLDIYPCTVFKQKRFPTDGLYVVGLAKGYDGALELVQRMTEEALDRTGRPDIKAFLLSKKEEV